MSLDSTEQLHSILQLWIAHLFLFLLARNYMNDSLRTDVFLRFSAETVACACIYLSAKLLQVSIIAMLLQMISPGFPSLGGHMIIGSLSEGHFWNLKTTANGFSIASKLLRKLCSLSVVTDQRTRASWFLSLRGIEHCLCTLYDVELVRCI